MKESEATLEKWCTNRPVGDMRTPPIDPTSLSEPSQAPSTKAIQVSRDDFSTQSGGEFKTRPRRNNKDDLSWSLRGTVRLPVKAKSPSFLTAEFATLPCAKVSNHCIRPFKDSASLASMLPLARTSESICCNSSLRLSVWPRYARPSTLFERSTMTPNVLKLALNSMRLSPSFAKITPSKSNNEDAASSELFLSWGDVTMVKSS